MAEAAVRLTPSTEIEDIRRGQINAGYHWAVAGEVGRGRALMTAALKDMGPGPARADLRWRLGMLAHLDGDLAEAVRLLAEARSLGAGDLEAQVATKLCGLYTWQGRLPDSLRCGWLALRHARAVGDQRAELQSLLYLSRALLLTGGLTAEELARIMELAATAGPFSAHEAPESALAMLDLVKGDAVSAAVRLDRARQLAVEQGDELGLASMCLAQVPVELAAGRWHQARRLAQDLARAVHKVPTVRSMGGDLLTAAQVEAYLGEAGVARSAAAALVAHAEERGQMGNIVEGLALQGFVALSCGDAQGAHAELGPLLDRLRAMGVREPGAVHLVWSEIDALVELGELDQAEAIAAELHDRGKALDRPLALATAARGLILAAHGDFVAADAVLQSSLADHDRLGWPFERARTLLAQGIVQRRAKQKRRARQTLQQALDIFDTLGSPLWSARTRTELGRIGGRPAATGALTATERRVAELVADGHTNREIADRLFLSAKTVAAHLTSVYAKLGVRSRTELSRRLPKNGT